MNLEVEIVKRLLTAALLGGLIGAERGRRNRGAGLRTHSVVCTASALIMIVSAYGGFTLMGGEDVRFDPTRMAAQVISGIGFLGAGIIIFRKNQVRNLTTAASVWAVAGVGLSTGAGLYFTSFAATIILCIILSLLKPLELKLFPDRHINNLKIELSNGLDGVKAVAQILKESGLQTVSLTVKHAQGDKKGELRVQAAGQEEIFVKLIEDFQHLPGVEDVEFDGHIYGVHKELT
ncbi:MAG: MgtC/SapB family protein [Candidatus Melainabacteria bacterium]|nr:MgtC/SapB family protein [Candidatus Melainabacteria bacterium]